MKDPSSDEQLLSTTFMSDSVIINTTLGVGVGQAPSYPDRFHVLGSSRLAGDVEITGGALTVAGKIPLYPTSVTVVTPLAGLFSDALGTVQISMGVGTDFILGGLTQELRMSDTPTTLFTQLNAVDVSATGTVDALVCEAPSGGALRLRDGITNVTPWAWSRDDASGYSACVWRYDGTLGANSIVGEVARLSYQGNFHCQGTLSSVGTKSFVIPMPGRDEATEPQRRLKHYCQETGQEADTKDIVYYYQVSCAANKVPTVVQLPSWFPLLCGAPLFFVSAAGVHCGTGFAELTQEGTAATQSMSVAGSKAGLYNVQVNATRLGVSHETDYSNI